MITSPLLSNVWHRAMITPVRPLLTSVEHDPVSGSRSNRILQFRTGSGSDWISKIPNRIRYGYPNCIDHCSKMLNQTFIFGQKPDWIKYLDSSTGLGSDQIAQWKFWIGLGLQKSPICSTLLLTRLIHISPSCWEIYRLFEIITVRWIGPQIQCSIQIHCFKQHSVRYELYFKKYLIVEGSSGSNG